MNFEEFFIYFGLGQSLVSKLSIFYQKFVEIKKKTEMRVNELNIIHNI